MDNPNPLRHMLVWNCIATFGLLFLLLIFNASTEAARAKIFESLPNFLLGGLFWLFIALLFGLIVGFFLGLLLWFYTYSARVTENRIVFYYLRIWLSFGLPLALVYGGIAWWYFSSQQWNYLPWTDVPYIRDIWLAWLWLVIVPLVGATRFIDSLYVDVRAKKKSV